MTPRQRTLATESLSEDAREFLAVGIVDHHLPVMMLAPPIAATPDGAVPEPTKVIWLLLAKIFVPDNTALDMI